MVRYEPDRIETNQRALSAAIAEVRTALRRAAKRDAVTDAAEQGNPSPQTLEILCTAFGLSQFERGILLMCAGIELEGEFPSLCAAAQDDAARPFPTFSLALAALPDPHWSALTPLAPFVAGA